MTAPQDTTGTNEFGDAGALDQPGSEASEAQAQSQATPPPSDARAGPDEASSTQEGDDGQEHQAAKAQQQVSALTDALQRERADFLNYRRRVAQEREELAERVRANALQAILPALDDLERALDQTPASQAQEPWVEGFRLVGRKLLTLLQQAGIARIGAVGEPFDPRLHEALAERPADHPDEKADTIKEVIRPGYRLGDRVLRPAQVIVVGGLTSSREKGNHA